MKVKKKRVIALALLMTIIMQFASIKESYALSAYFLQVLIDDGNSNFAVDVVFDNPGKKLGLPIGPDSMAKQIERQLGSFRSLKNNENISPTEYLSTDTVIRDSVGFTEALVFTFPGWPKNTPEDITSESEGSISKEASGHDYQLAQRVASNLGGSLQDVFTMVTGGMASGREDVIKYGQEIIRAVNTNGSITFTKDNVVVKSTFSNPSTSEIPNRPRLGVYANDPHLEYKKVSVETSRDGRVIDSHERVLLYKIGKGYGGGQGGEKEETAFLTWSHLITQALSNAHNQAIVLANAHEVHKPGIVERGLITMLVSFGNGLASMLGLYTLNELVYGEGTRGGANWVFGVMPISWWYGAMMFYIIFFFISLLTFSIAVGKMILELNIHTANPIKKVSIMEGFYRILTSVILLFLNIPIIFALFAINHYFVQALYQMTDGNLTNIMAFAGNAGSLAAVFISFAYLGITIYFNFIYVARQVSITFLVGLSPLFIQMGALKGDLRQTIGAFYRDLAGNVFVQTLHCVALMMFVSGGMVSRNIERFVVLISIVAITEMARALLFGQGGGMLNKMGMSSMGAAMGIAAAGAGVAVGAAKGYIPQGAGGGIRGKLGGSSGVGSENGSMGGSIDNMMITEGAPLRGGATTTGMGSEALNKRSDGGAKMPTSISNGESGVKLNQENAKNSLGGLTNSPNRSKMSGKDIAIGAMKGTAKAAGTAAGVAALAGLGAGSSHPLGSMIAAKGAMSLTSSYGKGLGASARTAKDNFEAFSEGRVDGKTAEKISNNAGVQAYESIGSFPQGTIEPPSLGSSVSDIDITSASQTYGADGFYSSAYADDIFSSRSGVTDIVPSKDGESALFTYDMSSANNDTKDRINYAASLAKAHGEAREQGNSVQMTNTGMLLGQMGVDDVLVHPDGKVSVAYNQEGLRNMGVEKINEYGKGDNKRYEFKHAPENTSHTLKSAPVSKDPIDAQKYRAVARWKEENSSNPQATLNKTN